VLLDQIAAQEDAGVVDQDADRADQQGEVLCQLAAALVVGDVENEAARLAAVSDDRIGDRTSRIAVDVGGDDLGAGGGGAAGDCRTVAAPGAGHQGEPPEQHVLHGNASRSASPITASSPIWLTSSRISRASKARHCRSSRPLCASTMAL